MTTARPQPWEALSRPASLSTPLVRPNGDAFERLLGEVRCTAMAARYFDCSPDWNLPEVTRPNDQLWVCVGGGADFVIHGAPHRLRPGAVLVMPSLVRRHGCHDPRHPLQVYLVQFTARFYGVLDLPAVCRWPVVIQPSDRLWPSIVATAATMAEEFAVAAPGHALAANGECARLVALLWRELVRQERAQAQTQALPLAALSRLAPVFRLIEARYAKPLRLQDLAACVHLHPAYFSALFKRLTGLPPLRYLARYRMERVRELLLATDLTMQEIASITGYRDPYALTAAFRRLEGMAPTAYRRAKAHQELP